MSVELSRVHLQRLQRAVEAARAGGDVRFRINPGEPRTIVWTSSAKPRTQHAICNAFGNAEPWLRAVTQAFQEMCNRQDESAPKV